MCRLTRYLIRILFAVLIPVILIACGSNSSGPSSGVLSGFSAVRDINGVVWTFGANGYGQLGNNSTTDSHSPVNVGIYDQVAIGGGHVVALRNGIVYTWGYDSNGQLGNGNTSNSSNPVQIGLSSIKQVAAGARFSLALANDGTVWAWGNNNRGQLGNNSTTDSHTPVQVNGLSGISMIAAGGEFALALDGSGNVWAWGSNDNGQLGNNSTASTATPVQVPSSSLTGVTQIAAGASHSLAVVGANKLYSWGYNSFGQLGNGSAGININQNAPASADQLVPGQVSLTGTQITMISAGLSHSMAVVDGTVYAWGYNFFGQIGNGATLYTNNVITTPQVVPIGSNFFSAIATGNESIALSNDGHIWTWGMNTYGQLGDGTTTDRSTPAIVPGH